MRQRPRWPRDGIAEHLATVVPFDDRLWVSTDGAQTWKERSFPADRFSPAGELKGLAGTPWIDGSRWLLAVDVMGDPSPTSTAATVFYESTDDGRSWHFIHQLPDFQGSVMMLSPTDWIACSNGSGAECWSTRDAAANWRETRSPDLDRLEQLSFASVDHGWGIVKCNDSFSVPISPAPPGCDESVQSVLLETADGGETWRPIE